MESRGGRPPRGGGGVRAEPRSWRPDRRCLFDAVRSLLRFYAERGKDSFELFVRHWGLMARNAYRVVPSKKMTVGMTTGSVSPVSERMAYRNAFSRPRADSESGSTKVCVASGAESFRSISESIQGRISSSDDSATSKTIVFPLDDSRTADDVYLCIDASNSDFVSLTEAELPMPRSTLVGSGASDPRRTKRDTPHRGTNGNEIENCRRNSENEPEAIRKSYWGDNQI